MSSNIHIHTHNPYALLKPTSTSTSTPSPTTTPYALLLLNQPPNIPALTLLLPNAKLLICADGAANHLYDYHISCPPPPPASLTSSSPSASASASPAKHRIPDAIIGDLDSLKPEVGDYYQDLGTEVIRDGDQFSTDFMKCLKYWRGRLEGEDEDKELDVVVFGGLGGRVDQGFSLVHHLYLARKDRGLLVGRMVLVSERSVSFVLGMGVNEVHVGEREGQGKVFEENVGVIPVMGPARISLKGFEWDVEDWDTEFGGQISTSNHLRSEKVIVDVKTGGQCLFTLELAESLCSAP